jgi:hypothetical protein
MRATEWIGIEISPSRPKNLRHFARHVNSRRKKKAPHNRS